MFGSSLPPDNILYIYYTLLLESVIVYGHFAAVSTVIIIGLLMKSEIS